VQRASPATTWCRRGSFEDAECVLAYAGGSWIPVNCNGAFRTDESVPAAELIGLKTPDATPAEAETKVGHALAGMARPFDVIILGMGDDGHIASLFPHAAELKRAMDAGPDELVCAVDRPDAAGAAARLSMTLPAILGARWIVLLIEGQGKLDVVGRARNSRDAAELPVCLVLNQSDVPVEVWWAP